jgi:APA family basic amino acid/polyamine antiporter
VLILRKREPNRHRPFRTPMAWVVCPLAIAGCLLLFLNLSMYTLGMFAGWAIIGFVVYALYGHRNSELARGIAHHGGPKIDPEPPFHEGPQA